MCDNKPTFVTKNTKISNIKTNIDKFYDNRKILFDICGNIINKDKYLFIDILSTYLVDIVNSIDIEINKSTRNSMINWREKKNPKLLSKFINSDDNINIINRSMNKITSSNYMTIVDEISDALVQDNFRKIPEYCKYLFDTIIKKCLNDEHFIKDYLQFLVSFKGVIKININEHINTFITEIASLLNKNNNLLNNTYFSFAKEISNYYNIGIIFSNLYCIKTETNLFSDNMKLFNFTEAFIYEKFMSCLHNINSFLDWLPTDMTDLNSRIYLIFGIIEVIGNKLFDLMNQNDKNLFNDILTLIYNVNNIPNKIKFKVLDIQDMVKTFEKTKIKINENTIFKQKIPINVIDNLLNDIPENENDYDIKYDLPVQTPTIIEKKIYKPINYSSLKLVQMKTNKPISEVVPEIVYEVISETVPETVQKIIPETVTIKEDIKKEIIKTDFNTNEIHNSEVNNQNSQFYKPKKNYNTNTNNNNNNNYNSNNNYKNKFKEQINLCETDKNDNLIQNQNKKYYKNNKNNNHNNLPKKQNDTIYNKPFNNEEDDGFIKVERKSKMSSSSSSSNSFSNNSSNISNSSNSSNSNNNYEKTKNFKK